MSKEKNKYENTAQKIYEILHIIDSSSLSQAFDLGLIPINKLKDNQYYLGTCKNASVAKWDEKNKKFFYMLWKFGHGFPESVYHPENDKGCDVFIPICETIPSEHQVIK